MERFPAPERKFIPAVLLVPFFGGKASHLKRHIQFVNEIGFDAAVVPLQIPNLRDPRLPISRDGLLGLKHVWADRIEDALIELNRPTILFTFSSPSASALEVVARNLRTERQHGSPLFQKAGKLLWGKPSPQNGPGVSVLGMVADSGPFVNLWSCNWKYMYHEAGIEFPLLRGAATAASVLLWGPDYEKTLHQDLKLIGSKIPILNIRGWNDKLVSIEAMDNAFPRGTVLNLKVVPIPEAGHLDGLKKFPETYCPAVSHFLSGMAKNRIDIG
ncbi:MAG: hypothetical protein K2X47_00330 [Bdellovibrionales bacterium]|nr:hypothetical protein [Bdellovibrionales bacterium]